MSLTVAITGGTSQVGIFTVKKLLAKGYKVKCVVRKTSKIEDINLPGVELCKGDVDDLKFLAEFSKDADYFVHIAGIWRAENILDVCSKNEKIKKVLFVGSTSRFKKLESIDPYEKQLAHKMAEAEEKIIESPMNTVVLRATMIYGMDRDKNIMQIIQFIKKYRFYPLIGRGLSYKHPVYMEDVASAVVSCIENEKVHKKDYIVAGKAPIRYREMLREIKAAMKISSIILPVPTCLAVIAFKIYKLLKPDTYINEAMIKRVNEDISYDITPAVNDFGYAPISFQEGIRNQVGYLRSKGIL